MFPILNNSKMDKDIKGQENPEFCASGSFGSFPYIPVVGSGTSGNRPVGPEILSLSF